jgi:hypothetical protein
MEESFARTDAVVHCGDFVDASVWAYLEGGHDQFYAVQGNMDSTQWAYFLPQKLVVRLGGLRLGIVHGAGLDLKRLSQELPDVFQGDVDLICFGHTHVRTWIQNDKGIHIVNPGSFRLPKDGARSYAIITWQSLSDLQVQWQKF